MNNIYDIIRTKNVNDLKKCNEIIKYDDLIVEIGKHTKNVIDIIGDHIWQIEFHMLQLCDYAMFCDDMFLLIINYNDCEQFAFIPIFDGAIQPICSLYYIFGYLFYNNIEKIISYDD